MGIVPSFLVRMMILKIDNDCYKDQSLHRNRPLVYGEGAYPSRIMFIGDAPRELDQSRGRPFVDQPGKILDIAFRIVGFDRSEVYLTNVVKHTTPDDRDPYVLETKAYLPILREEVEIVDPDLIVLLGGVAALQFFGKKSVEDKRGFLHKHSSEEFGDRNVLVTYHPKAFLGGNPMWDVFTADLRRARRIIDREFEETTTDTHVIDTLLGVKDLVSLLEKDFYTWDLETSGFNKWTDEIVCWSFSSQEGESFVVPFYDGADVEIFSKPVKATVQKLLHDLIVESDAPNGTWVGQFDYNFFSGQNNGFEWRPQNYKNWLVDGMLMHCLLEEEMPHNLEYVASVHTDMKPWNMELQEYKKKYKIKTYKDIPGRILWPYAGGDTDATLRLINKFLPRLHEEGLLDFYFDQQHEMAKVITKIGFMGIPVRLDALDALKEEYKIKRDNVEIRTYEAAGRKFNVKSWKQKGEILYRELGLPEISKRTKGGNPATDKETLEELAKLNLHPLPGLMAELNGLEYLLSSGYLGDKAKSIRANTESDGRCRCNWSPQETGRYGANTPNLTNIPREGGFRELFEAPEGWKIIEADYSQAELRYAAYRVGETTVIEALENGFDGHTASAADIFGVSLAEVTPQQRSVGKTVNFLVQYGGGPGKLAKTAGITVSKARGIIKKFFMLRKHLDAFMKDIAVRARSKEAKDRVVVNVFGRVRHIPVTLTKEALAHTVRSAINSDAQGGVADLVWRAMIKLNRWFEEMELQAHFVLVLHDGVYVMCPDEEVDLVQAKMEEYMLEPLPEIGAVIPVDFKVRQRWEGKD